MLAGLGIVFGWLGNGLAALFLAFVVFKMFVAQSGDNGIIVSLSIFFALTSWVTGKALRYMLAGDRAS